MKNKISNAALALCLAAVWVCGVNQGWSGDHIGAFDSIVTLAFFGLLYKSELAYTTLSDQYDELARSVYEVRKLECDDSRDWSWLEGFKLKTGNPIWLKYRGENDD